PRVPPRSPHGCPRSWSPRSRVAVALSRCLYPSTPPSDYSDYAVVFLSSTKTLDNLMKLLLHRHALLKGLQMLQNIGEPRQAVPPLPSGAELVREAEGAGVRRTGTDLEVGARGSVPAKVGAKGSITVSARKLAGIVQEWPASEVELKGMANVAVRLR